MLSGTNIRMHKNKKGMDKNPPPLYPISYEYSTGYYINHIPDIYVINIILFGV